MIKVFVVLLGGFIGYGLVAWIISLSDYRMYANPLRKEWIAISGALTGLGLAYFTTNRLVEKLVEWIMKAHEDFQKASSRELIMGSVGVIIGLIIANLLSITFIKLPYVGILLAIMLNFLFSYLGALLFTKKYEIFDDLAKVNHIKQKDNELYKKVIDTSAIIDGRIADIYRTGFLEGILVIPEFVLKELRHIADSHEPEKRNRGRRGLEVLNVLQKELNANVEILQEVPNDNKDEEVDVRLMKLAQELKAGVLTTDYNLNRIAEFQGIRVLNINELAKAIKPIALPGEEMTIKIIKEGKEAGQGVGYLEDGTMVVVDEGNKYMGESLDVKVTHVLQTATGRMIFAKFSNRAEDVV